MDAAWIALALVAAGVNALPASTDRQKSNAPVQHTVNFAGQTGWPGSPTTSATTGYDRYGQPITNAAQSTLPPPPSISSNAQNAFNSASNSLRDGVESGIRAANQQFGATSTTPASIAASQQGWTSIGTSIPAPPLLVPKSPMANNNLGSFSTTSTSDRSSLTFPSTTTNTQQPLHSVLAEPQRPNSTASNSDSWSNFGSSQQPSIGSSSSSLGSTVRESDLVALPMSSTPQQEPRSTVAARPNSSWPEGDSWTQTGQPSLGTANGMSGNTSMNRQPQNGMQNTQFASNQQPGQSGSMTGFNNVNTMPNMGQNMGQNAASGVGTMNSMGNGMNQSGQYMNGQNGQNGQSGRTAQLEPSSPLLMVLIVLGLAGSLAANMFLGMSYLDARQKYQSLVRKTADTFRRVKAVAA